MPTIVLASPKGGAGKTTTAVVLATELARQSKVVFIDADPNRPVSAWARLPGRPDSLEVRSDVSEQNVIDEIEEAARSAPFAIVDLEGTASMTVGYAISRADLVIIPTQGSQLDARQAARAIRLVEQQEKAFRRRIPHAVLLTRTSAAIQPRSLKSIREQLEIHGVDVFQTQLIERDAFRALFAFGGTLETLDRSMVSNVDSALANARALTKEVVERLRAARPAERRAVLELAS
jgi:chromosome partitioning protein